MAAKNEKEERLEKEYLGLGEDREWEEDGKGETVLSSR